MPLIVEFACGPLPLGQVASLKAESVIKLDALKSDLAVMFIGDHPKFLGHPGLQHRNRAAEITGKTHSSTEEKYR